MKDITFTKNTREVEPVTSAELASDFDYWQNGLKVTHYVANNLPLPMSERFFKVTCAPRLLSTLGRQ